MATARSVLAGKAPMTALLGAAACVCSLLTGCASLLGDLRADFDDRAYESSSPIVGGRWTERNFLGSEGEDAGDAPDYRGESYRAVGHSDRSPAALPLRGARRSPLGATEDLGSSGSLSENQETRDSASYGNPAPESVGGVTVGELPPRRLRKADFRDDVANEGSLWASDGQTNYYFTKNKVRGVGDIVSVGVEKELHRDLLQEVARTLEPEERQFELALAQRRLEARARGLPDPDAPMASPEGSAPPEAVAALDRAPAAKSREDVEVRKATVEDLDLTKTVTLRVGESILGEIVERYPNGNYKIRGTRRLSYRGKPKLVSMVAIVRGTDIGEDDTVASGKLYEYRLETQR